MTNYIRLLLEEQEDTERARRQDRTWREKWTPTLVRFDTAPLPTGAGRTESGAAAETGLGLAARPGAAAGGGSEREERPAGAERGSLLPPEQWTEGLTEGGGADAGAWTAYQALSQALRAEAVEPAALLREAERVSAGESRTYADSPGESGSAASRKAWAEETVQTDGTAADWTYRMVRRSLTELPAPRRETRVVTLSRPERGTGSENWDAERLDRIFRRDARRFDGGFQLL